MTGLINVGNTCFINSTLQCLFNINELNTFLDTYNSTGLLLTEYNDLRKLMEKGHTSITPHRFIAVIQHVSKEKKMDLFTGFSQNDLPEFLVFMLNEFHTIMSHKINCVMPTPRNKIDEECYKMFTTMYNSDYSIIIDLFYGILVSIISTDKIVSIKPEPFFTLDLPIPNTEIVTLDDCIQLYLKPESIQWFNEKDYIPSTKSVLFWKLPSLLFIVFKRFDNANNKNNKMIEVPLNPEINHCEYSLLSICNHYGGVRGGHYTTTIKKDKWYEIDDDSVSEIHESKIITKNAYCLLFRKKIM